MAARSNALRLLLPLAAVAAVTLPGSAAAFSQITDEDGRTQSRDGILAVPLPPLNRPAPMSEADPPANGAGAAPLDEDADEAPSAGERQDALDSRPLPVLYGEDTLPRPARDLRRRLMEIAKAGDIEALRPYLETGAQPTALSVAPVEGDPIDFLRQASGDGEGAEILAILLEVLSAGHVHMEAGSANEIFIWPYFAQVSIDDLDPREMVELFEIVTAGDYQTMLEFGAYHFYRVGISPEGRLEFFLAGD